MHRYSISGQSRERITRYLATDPVTEENLITKEIAASGNVDMPFAFGDNRTRLRLTIPLNVQSNVHKEFRQSLPIHAYRDKILNVILDNQVCIISGETGSGKTTQVPQYILEDSTAHGRKCRIICTQPRRLAATSIAARVAEERHDSVGNTVGYQIRMDCRVKKTTNLIFTTSGYLLRCLTGSENADVYKNVTHLILDEVHEREKVTDFLLIVIRDILKEQPHLKVILMSATIDSEMFSEYFDKCPVINVPGRMFDVKVYHLAETLMMVDYKTDEMARYIDANDVGSERLRKQLDDKVDELEGRSNDTFIYREYLCSYYEQIFRLVSDGKLPVDYLQYRTQRTVLSIAAELGHTYDMQILLLNNADPNRCDIHGKTSYDYAKDADSMDLLKKYGGVGNDVVINMDEQLKKALQDAYISTLEFPNDIDHELLFHVISYLHRETSRTESILVFLPGIDDIQTQKNMIDMELKDSDYESFVLHSGVNGTNASEVNRVFGKISQGKRKIILSTNIAETSITIDDVVHVIDLGKVKQQTYNAISNSTCLQSTVTSKACAKQRMGRAGRIQNGFCYRLYSKESYEKMAEYTVAEIQRVPLTEICLNARMLANDHVSIETFLSNALQPPATINIRKAIKLLQQIDALNLNEKITDLGFYLANMPVDCQLGKAVIYSVLMKCLDPVITIVSAISVKDPFFIAVDKEEAKAIFNGKKEFSDDSLSDHYMLLKVFNCWQTKKNNGAQFCHEKKISVLKMQAIAGVRKLIYDHLNLIKFIQDDSNTNFNQNSNRWHIVKACLTAGLYPNICCVEPITAQMVSNQGEYIYPGKSSVLYDEESQTQIDGRVQQLQINWMVFGEKIKVSKYSIVQNITPIPSIDMVFFAGLAILSEKNSAENEAIVNRKHLDIYQKISIWDFKNYECKDVDMDALSRNDEAIFLIDDWIQFSMGTKEAQLLLQLRQKFAKILIEFLKNPKSFCFDQRKESIINLICAVIQEEDAIEHSLITMKMMQCTDHTLIIHFNDDVKVLRSGRIQINPNHCVSTVVNKGTENEIKIRTDGAGRVYLSDASTRYIVSVSINSLLVGNIRVNGTEKTIEFNDVWLLNGSGLIDRRSNQLNSSSLISSTVLHIDSINENESAMTVQSTYGRDSAKIELHLNKKDLLINMK